MKIVGIGGAGLIGSKVVAKLAEHPLDDHALPTTTSAEVCPTRFAERLADNATAPLR